MTIATHVVTADFSGFAPNSRINADVVIGDNLRGIATAAANPPVGYVHGYIKASLENGELRDASGAQGVVLTSNDAALGIVGDLQYTFAFSNVTVDGVAAPGVIPNVTYTAPADGMAINLLEHIGTASAMAYPEVEIASEQISDAGAFGRQWLTIDDAADAAALIADYLGGVRTVVGETPTGVKNGTNTAFTTANPYAANKIAVYLNGLRESHFTQTNSTTITLGSPPISTDEILVDYTKG